MTTVFLTHFHILDYVINEATWKINEKQILTFAITLQNEKVLNFRANERGNMGSFRLTLMLK